MAVKLYPRDLAKLQEALAASDQPAVRFVLDGFG